jgi:hypothetical protein
MSVGAFILYSGDLISYDALLKDQVHDVQQSYHFLLLS